MHRLLGSALRRTSVSRRNEPARLYHASPTTRDTGHRVPNPFGPTPSLAPQSKISIHDAVDRAAGSVPRAANPYEPAGGDQPDHKRDEPYSSTAPLATTKEDVRAWLNSRSIRHSGTIQDRTFPLDDVKEVGSVANLTLLAQDGKAGAPEAMLLLAKSQMELEKSGLLLAEQRRAAAKVEASKILTWDLTSDRRYWDDTLPRDFIESLCWHLEAEGKGEGLLDWLAAWSSTPDMRFGAIKAFHPLHKNSDVRWPGTILAELIKANIYWDESRSANSALKTALFALDCTDEQHVQLPRALQLLERQLLSDQASPCSPELYNMFIARLPMVRGWWNMSTPASVQAHVADLYLYHPTDANARLMLQLCHDGLASVVRSDLSKLNRASHLLRAAYLCRLEGEDADATFLEELSQELHRKPWSLRRMLYECYRQDPKLRTQHANSPHTKALEVRHVRNV